MQGKQAQWLLSEDGCWSNDGWTNPPCLFPSGQTPLRMHVLVQSCWRGSRLQLKTHSAASKVNKVQRLVPCGVEGCSASASRGKLGLGRLVIVVIGKRKNWPAKNTPMKSKIKINESKKINKALSKTHPSKSPNPSPKVQLNNGS